ncbi:MAG TPA: L-threonylcarbamoyladenylate synthase [Methanoregulaceae archaeon]|nr:L-threonylcarbamoyladenylate synthase [Methanoregulaceae archaeon]
MDPVEKAAYVLMHDGIVIYPTDTIYGLGGDAFSDEAILRVYEAKKRPLSQPVSIAVCDCDMIHGVAKINEYAATFIDHFLPGPVTVILPARNSVPAILTGGTGMLGIRLPNHPLALRLISLVGSPITATSANMSGGRDPLTPLECHVAHDYLLDGGILPGTPSTVVDIGERRILRPGALVGEVVSYLSRGEGT